MTMLGILSVPVLVSLDLRVHLKGSRTKEGLPEWLRYVLEDKLKESCLSYNALKTAFFFTFNLVLSISFYIFSTAVYLSGYLISLKFQFPIGIDADRFIRALETHPVQEHIKELKERFAGRKVYFFPIHRHLKFWFLLFYNYFIYCGDIFHQNNLPWQVMLGVDRLDMIKGIPQKILAFEKFLEENPDWHDKVVLLQIAVPTRTDVPECTVLPCFP